MTIAWESGEEEENVLIKWLLLGICTRLVVGRESERANARERKGCPSQESCAAWEEHEEEPQTFGNLWCVPLEK